MAITGGGNLNGTQSVLSHNNPNGMSVTKRHQQDGSSKWLPSVSYEKKNRPGQNPNATTTIQIGKGEIQITN